MNVVSELPERMLCRQLQTTDVQLTFAVTRLTVPTPTISLTTVAC